MSSTSFLSQVRKGHSNSTSRVLKELANKYQKLYAQNTVVEDENLTDEGFTIRSRMLMRDKLRYISQITTIPDFNVPFEPDGTFLRFWLKGNHTGMTLRDISKIDTPHIVNVNHDQQLCLVDSGGLDVGYLGTYGGSNSSPCWKLNGTDETAFVDDTTDLQVKATTTGFSITAWIKISDFTQHNGTNRRIVTKTDDSNNAYALFITATNKAVFAVKFSNGTEYKVETPGTLVADTWYFIAGTFNSATPAAKIYLDGTVSTTSFGSSVTYPTGTDLHLFGNGQTGGDPDEDDLGAFSGYIRDIRIYRELLLSQQQVTNFNTNRNTISNIAFGSVPIAGFWFSPDTMELSSFTSQSFTDLSFNL